jgi:hypothetical protein
MTVESKRGASGGNARAKNLSKEERTEIASKAAKARWAKKKAENNPIETTISYVNTKTGEVTDASTIIDGEFPEVDEVPAASSVTTPQHPYALPVPPSFAASLPKPAKPKKKTKVPKEFGAAHSYAEKRLAEIAKERGQMVRQIGELTAKVHGLDAETPGLLQLLRALKSTETPNQSFPNPQAYQTLPMPIAVGIDPTLQARAIIPQAEVIPPAPIANGGAVDFDSSQQDMPEDAFLRGAAGGDRGWV